jgi:hypothetical protein
MLTGSELACSLLVPAVVAALVARGGIRDCGSWRVERAAIAGYLAGHLLLSTAKGVALRRAAGELGLGAWQSAFVASVAQVLRPHEARDALPVLLTAAIVLVWLETRVPRRFRPMMHAVWLLLGIAFATRLLWGSVYWTTQWSGLQRAGVLGGLGIALGLPGILAGRGTSARDSVSRLSLLLQSGIAACVAVTLMLSGSKIYGLLGLAAAASLSGCSLVSRGDNQEVRFTLPPRVPPLLVGSLLVLGLFYAEVTGPQAALLFLGFGASSLQLTQPNVWRALRWNVVVLTVAGCLALAVVAGAGWSFAKSAASESANPYRNLSGP